jgi:hypothetical protein
VVRCTSTKWHQQENVTIPIPNIASASLDYVLILMVQQSMMHHVFVVEVQRRIVKVVNRALQQVNKVHARIVQMVTCTM